METALEALKNSALKLRQLSTEKKNEVLLTLAKNLLTQSSLILSENSKDLAKLSAESSQAFRDRLTLTPSRISSLVEGLKQVALQPDPVHELVEKRTLPNGLQLKKIRAPLGILFMIFESRPNVILECFSLAFKAGNGIILRGGSESQHSNKVIFKIMEETLVNCNLSYPVFYGIQDYDRKWVECLLKRTDLIDVVIPRGGEKLIQFVQEQSLMPIIKNDRGLCHTYVDDEANLQMALDIVTNAKTQRPGVCNSLETVLVHKDLAALFIEKLYEHTKSIGLLWRVDKESLNILKNKSNVQLASIQLATTEDWDTEHLDLIINCRVVADLEDAIEHIEKHGSLHSEAIITSNEKKAHRFQDEVDAAVVYWNASTRFTDGFEFGLGGELGISTQKLHVRGPVGLKDLTTPRWIVDGTGQIRK
ncbi:MAG: glutamate-5-semialdehyde dehydrogenase [Deltaproteobacteria bacterium]|nr:glutamate-5-semialdehyde dehydrogenase [Deltaproteobacteria bacterium]